MQHCHIFSDPASTVTPFISLWSKSGLTLTHTVRFVLKRLSETQNISSQVLICSGTLRGAAAKFYGTCFLSATTLLELGGNVDWSHDGQWIAYDAPDFENWTQTWLMRPEGSEQTCLTPALWWLISAPAACEVVKESKGAGVPAPFSNVPI